MLTGAINNKKQNVKLSAKLLFQNTRIGIKAIPYIYRDTEATMHDAYRNKHLEFWLRLA